MFSQEFVKQLLRNLSPYELISYADSNFAKDSENQK